MDSRSKFNRKVIISCALTGSIHTPTMSPFLPITPDQIAKAGIDACEAGASILHCHARDPETGKPTPDPEVYRKFLPKIKEGCDAVINITTGGGLGMTAEERCRAASVLQPEIASLNLGSTNFFIEPMAARYKEWKYDWELPYLQMTRDFVLKNTFQDLEVYCKKLLPNGTRLECEVYEIGQLYNLKYLCDKGLMPKPTPEQPVWIQGVFGILGGMGSDYQNIQYLRERADTIFGRENHYFSVLGAGAAQLRNGTQSALMGGHCRVGMEDSLFIGKGKLTESNADQVRKVRVILENLGFEIATPAETREMLQLKGKDNVKF